MKLTERLCQEDPEKVWQEYCGFLELDSAGYMKLQYRLLEEQLALWSACPLGRHFLGSKRPVDYPSLRQAVPLTTYEDYADILLQRRPELLPAPPITWIETTWEGGKRPVKTAPYTQGMVDTFSRNGVATMLLASAEGWGKFSVGEKIFSGLAPMPFLTGLIGLILDEEYGFDTMPPRSTIGAMSFSERSKLGLKQALTRGMDYFLSMGSVAYYLSLNLSAVAGGGGGKKSLLNMPVSAVIRLARAKIAAKREGRDILPKDLFQPRGFICAGTDNACYKDDLEKMWGVRPLELFAGTEAGMVGCETWNRKDLYFFPDTAFYEFLPEKYIRANDGGAPTLLMDEVQPGGVYELVVTTFKGGAFARYRTGDVYRCTGIGNPDDHSLLPRFCFVDRVPDIIDIAGFTRITRRSIEDVILLSALPIQDWAAAKEFDTATGHPYLHLYVEVRPGSLTSRAVTVEVLRRHMEIYFNYLDNDYDSLKKILGLEPLQITILRGGTFRAYQDRYGQEMEKVSPPREQLAALARLQAEDWQSEGFPAR